MPCNDGGYGEDMMKAAAVRPVKAKLDHVTALLCATCTELERINPDLVARNSPLFDWFHEHKKEDAKHGNENQFRFNFMHDLS
jgi:hypothetical protein